MCTLTVKELFDFVTDVSITASNLDDYLDRLMDVASSRSLQDLTAQEKIDEEVWVKVIFSCSSLEESFSCSAHLSMGRNVSMVNRCCQLHEIERDCLYPLVYSLVETFEPVREKTNNLGSDQVQHKLGCTVTEDG